MRRLPMLGAGMVAALVMASFLTLAGEGAQAASLANSAAGKLPATDVLSAVSCPSVTSCFAVGFHRYRVNGTVALVEHWDGSSWSVQPTPTVPGPKLTKLTAVACSTVTDCLAVGWQVPNPDGGAIAERWNGSVWTLVGVPTPKALGGDVTTQFRGVTCLDANSCVAVGFFNCGDCHPCTNCTEPLAEGWDGTSWALEATPESTNPDPLAFLSVACTTPRACVAAGIGDESPFVARWNGSAWKAQSIPPNPSGLGGELYGVACSSATACTAIGYGPGPDYFGTTLLAYRWNGVAWVLESVPTPINPPFGAIVLDAVACPTETLCLAVGWYDNHTLAEQWNGSTWQVQPTPPLHPAPFQRELDGVACSSSTACTAVGFIDGFSANVTLAERWTGSQWRAQATPNPPPRP